MKIAICSFQRYDQILQKSIRLFYPTGIPIFVFVDGEREAKLYEAAGVGKYATIIAVPGRGIVNCRNYMFDYFPSGEEIITACDDVKNICKLEEQGGKKSLKKLSAKEIKEFCEAAFRQTKGCDLKMWGVYPVANAFYMDFQVKQKAFIIASFSGVVNTPLRMDTELPLKEDYDFSLAHIQKYGGVYRFDDYCVEAAHYTNKGGAVSYRTPEKEAFACKLILEKYKGMVRPNPRRENELIISSK